jgi:hypothetical protein
VPAQMQLVSAEERLVPAEADHGSAEEQLVPAQMQLVSAEERLMATRARPADTARKRTPSVVTGDPGPVLPSEQETGATAFCAEATRPVESVEALTSPQSCEGMPAGVGEEPREPQKVLHRVHPERGAMRLAGTVGEASCPEGTRGSSKSSVDCRQQRDSTW